MEEKIIIKNEHYNKNKYKKICIMISILFCITMFALEIINGYFFYPINDFKTFLNSDGGYKLIWFFKDALFFYILIPVLPSVFTFLILNFVYFVYSKEEIVLTNKRVYGKTIFGVHVDLPIQSVSGVSEIKLFKGLSVSTSSKAIKFVFVKNASNIRKEISALLMSRVEDKSTEIISSKEKESGADELKKFKDLLDMGAITQEEFDAKKKELLGL